MPGFLYLALMVLCMVIALRPPMIPTPPDYALHEHTAQVCLAHHCIPRLQDAALIGAQLILASKSPLYLWGNHSVALPRWHEQELTGLRHRLPSPMLALSLRTSPWNQPLTSTPQILGRKGLGASWECLPGAHAALLQGVLVVDRERC